MGKSSKWEAMLAFETPDLDTSMACIILCHVFFFSVALCFPSVGNKLRFLMFLRGCFVGEGWKTFIFIIIIIIIIHRWYSGEIRRRRMKERRRDWRWMDSDHVLITNRKPTGMQFRLVNFCCLDVCEYPAHVGIVYNTYGTQVRFLAGNTSTYVWYYIAILERKTRHGDCLVKHCIIILWIINWLAIFNTILDYWVPCFFGTL